MIQTNFLLLGSHLFSCRTELPSLADFDAILFHAVDLLGNEVVVSNVYVNTIHYIHIVVCVHHGSNIFIGPKKKQKNLIIVPVCFYHLKRLYISKKPKENQNSKILDFDIIAFD